MKLTRRKLALALVSPAVAAAQTPAPPGDQVKTAADQLRTAAAALGEREIPMSTEPAFQFKP
jgi:hypothetical protein